MNQRCPVCQLKFGRESGYFVGAMYFSFAMSMALLFALSSLIQWAAALPLERAATVAIMLWLPFVPAIFRYSRVLWIHLDRTIDRS